MSWQHYWKYTNICTYHWKKTKCLNVLCRCWCPWILRCQEIQLSQLRLEKNLKVSLKSHQGHIILLLYPISMVKVKHILRRWLSVQKKGHNFCINSWWMQKLCLSRCNLFLIIVVHNTSISSIHWQEDASAHDQMFVIMHHFCIWTHIVEGLNKYSWTC